MCIQIIAMQDIGTQIPVMIRTCMTVVVMSTSMPPVMNYMEV